MIAARAGSMIDWRRVGAAVIAFCVLATSACTTESARFRPLRTGDPAPEYVASALSGDSVSIRALRGSVVVLNIWATWCVPCRREMPALDSLARAFANRGVRVVGVSVDEGASDERIAGFLEAHGIGFEIWRDPDARVAAAFQTRGVPETFLIDREGRIAAHWIGGVDTPSARLAETVARVVGGTL